MTIEQRVERLEQSARRWRQGCVLGALALVIALHIGAEPAKDTSPPLLAAKCVAADVVTCHSLILLNKDRDAAVLMPMPNGGASFELGRDTDFPIELISDKTGSVIHIGSKTTKFQFNAEVNDNHVLVSGSALGDTLAEMGATKAGGQFIASNLSGEYCGMNFAGAAKGITPPSTRPANE